MVKKKCRGLWTRVQGECRSVLDYMLVWKGDQENLISMLIDEEKEYASAGIDDNNNVVYSDHNTIIGEFNWLMEEGKRKSVNRIITRKGYDKIIKRGKSQ